MACIEDRDGAALALIYARVSGDDQARQGVSLTVQSAGCRRYTAEHGWTVAGEYRDVMSGARDDRPQYRALLREVRRLRGEGYAVALVVASLDRLGRSMVEGLRCREELKRRGVSLHCAREGGEVSDLVANILAAVAQEEVQQLSRRVVAARRHVIAGGWYDPGSCPWGYRLRPATADERAASAPRSVLALDPVMAPYVREMFRRAARGENQQSLSRWIDGLPAEAHGGRAMHQTSVGRALRSLVYVARPRDGDPDVLRRPTGRWPALVDDATWRDVQERLAGPLRPQASGRYLLTGFLRCHRC